MAYDFTLVVVINRLVLFAPVFNGRIEATTLEDLSEYWLLPSDPSVDFSKWLIALVWGLPVSTLKDQSKYRWINSGSQDLLICCIQHNFRWVSQLLVTANILNSFHLHPLNIRFDNTQTDQSFPPKLLFMVEVDHFSNQFQITINFWKLMSKLQMFSIKNLEKHHLKYSDSWDFAPLSVLKIIILINVLRLCLGLFDY